MKAAILLVLAGCATQSQSMRAHSADVEMCYAMGLQRNQQLAGKVVVELDVGEGGHVKTARIVSTTLNDGEVETCIAELAARWDFPDQRPGLVTVPFDLGGESRSEP
jgi:hypothetical protein